MLSISAISKQEKNKLSTDSAMLILLDIQLKEMVRIVYNNEDIIYRGETYQAFPLRIGDTSEDNTGSDPSLKIEVDNVARGMEFYVDEAGGAVGTKVILRVVNSKNLDGQPDLEEHYVVTDTHVDQSKITFVLGNGYSTKTRRPMHRYMKNNCPFAYKGCRCGYAGGLPSCNHTLSDCRKHKNSKRFGGFPGIDQKGVYIND